MADDRYRRVSTNTTPPLPGAKRAAAAARQPGPDPLVELARLIGQNETPARDSSRAARWRDEREALGQRIAQRGQGTSSQPTPGQTVQRRPAAPSQPTPDQAVQRRPAAPSQQAPDQTVQRRQVTPPQLAPDQTVQRRQAMPSQPAPEPSVEEGPQYERYPDQRYDGYTEPAAPSQVRSQTRVGHPHDIVPPDLSDPYRTDAGWRASRPKERTARPEQERTARPDRGAAHPAAPGGDARRPAARAPAQARESMPPAASDGARSRSPTTADYSRHEPAAEQAHEAERADESAAYGDAQAVADELGADAEPERYDETDAYVYDSEPRSRKLWAAVAILALAVIGTAGAYTYRLMVGGEEQQQSPPPVIRADTSPKKIASATQQNSNDKQIQERFGAGSAGERLVSREEQPLAIKDPNARTLVPETPPALSAPVTTAPSNARPFPTPGGAASEPKKIRTVTIRPEGDSGSTAASRAGAPAAAVPAVPVPAKAARPAAPASSGNTQTAVVTPQPRPTAHNYVVQISAQRSQADAEASFRVMQAKYPSVLGGRQPIIRRKESSKGVYYGTQVGPFASRGDAIQLCEELKAAGGNCFVQRN
jgi:hypothetical protein